MININEIKNQFKGEVETDEAALVKYSRDASIFEVKPKCVAHPKDAEDVKSLVKWALAQKDRDPEISITARSAGTDMSGGDLGESIIADFTSHFGKIIAIESLNPHPARQTGHLLPKGEGNKDGFASVEPGVYYRDFEKAALEKNLILPCYTASKSLNTIGGMVANNSAGEKSLVYGQTKDYVEELEVVLSDGEKYTFGELDDDQLNQKLRLPGFEGEVYRQMFRLIKDNYELIQKAKPTTSKNSAGFLLWEVCPRAKPLNEPAVLHPGASNSPLISFNQNFGRGVKNRSRFNLAKLITGSQGTLGLITKIKIKLVRPKAKSELLVLFLKDLSNLGEVVKCVAGHGPESFESFDDHTFKLAMKFLPDMIKRMRGNVFKLAFQFLPEVWMTLTGGVPKLILIAEFTGETEEEIYSKLLMAQKEVAARFKLKTHVTKSRQEAEKYWTVRRESFNLLRQHTHGLSTAPFIDDIVVHPDQLPRFLPELQAILDNYPSLIYTIAGHAGDANFHIIPLMDLSREDQRAIIPLLANSVYDLVLKYNGSITAEHNDGLIRSPYLEKMYGPEIMKLFAQVKRIFDPKNIFNPGKKVGASMDYALAHIKRTL